MEGMTLEKLQVIIEAQTKAYYEELKKVQQQTKTVMSTVETQTNRIKSTFDKIGKTVAMALSVTAIIGFGKSCIELGSALTEVQNVVDVTFGAMSDTINQFAKAALEQFGLSETSAKRYTSTLGAMLKSMGFNTEAAADMSMEMTELAADMASFYDLDTDVAFEKIRSGISGETEPLKQLGINMSVANLEAFALSQGITKAYNAMTQQEQAMLRYNYLMATTADAQGDFARTSDSWANQVRMLAEKFNALKAAIGKGLIAVLTPVIRVLNSLLSKILMVTDAFSNMIAKITGKNTKTTTTVSDIGGAADSAASSMGDVGAATDAAGKSAKKAAKEYGGLLSMDEVHSLTKNEGSDSGGAGSSGNDGTSGSELSENIVDAANETDDTLNPALEKLLARLKELQELFRAGFKAGLGDVDLSSITKAVEGIKKSLKDIFTAPEVVNAANNFANTLAYSLGQQAGAVASVGITIATNLLGGIDKYLADNQGRIKQFIVNMFDIGSDIATIQGNFAQAAANIFSVFGGENGQQVTANIIGIFYDAAMGVYELSAKLGRDVLDCLTRPFIDNQGSFKEAIDGLLGVAAGALGNIKQVVDSTVGKAGEIYDEHLAPMLNSLAEDLSSITGTILDVYNTYIIPVLEGLQQKVGPLIDEHIQPAINKGLELIGKIADAVKDIWEQTLLPFINWFIANIAPYIAVELGKMGSVFLTVAGVIADVVGSIFDVLGGLIDFIAGVFTGDWERAWEGIKTFFSGIWEAIKSIVSAVWENIKLNISTAIDMVAMTIGTVLNTIKIMFGTIWNAIKMLVSTVWNAIKTTISKVLNTISSIISATLNTIKTTFSTNFNNIKSTVTTVFNAIKSTISTIINAVNTTISTVLNSIRTIFSTILSSIKTTVSTNFNNIKSIVTTVIGSIQTGISGALNSISTNWNIMWNGMKATVINIFNGIWSAIKGVINSIICGVEKMANGVISGINALIKALNNLSFDVPDWVPEIGGKTFGFNISTTLSTISIPKLATGGVVDKATVAMIGEAGQEAVVPLENNTGWMDKIAGRIGEIISVNMRAIIGEMDNGSEYQTIQTIVKLDSKILAEQTDKYRKRRGYKMANA
nr:hypothetical protein [uncultured Lachnoclostridium sp.]